MNYIDREDHTRTDVGYYSIDHSDPIFEQAKFQKSYNRTEYGTDVYIFGFKYAKSSSWQQDIIVSLLDGFLYAIKEKHLTVSIGDIDVNDKTVDGLIQQYHDQLDPHTLDYYDLLTLSEEDGVTTRHLSYLENEDIIVKMMVKPGLHKRVGIIRYPGMKVFDKGYISSTVSFAGICIIKGKQISGLFGGMENIQHTKWELNRYDEYPELQSKAQKYRDRLYKDLTDLFNELKGQTETEDVDPDIGDCLPDPFSEEKKESETISDAVLNIGKTREVKVKPTASEERLWSALCLGPFFSYVQYRWGKSLQTVNGIKQHFFFENANRRSLTRNAVARLWWIGRLTYDEKRDDHYELTKLVCSHSDYIMHFIERNTSNSMHIMRPFLEAILGEEKNGIILNTNDAGELAKYLNLLGGMYVLDVMPEEWIKDKIIQKIHHIAQRGLKPAEVSAPLQESISSKPSSSNTKVKSGSVVIVESKEDGKKMELQPKKMKFRTVPKSIVGLQINDEITIMKKKYTIIEIR